MLDGYTFPFFFDSKVDERFPVTKEYYLGDGLHHILHSCILDTWSTVSSNVVIRVPRIYLPCFGIMLDDIVMFIKYRPFMIVYPST